MSRLASLNDNMIILGPTRDLLSYSYSSTLGPVTRVVWMSWVTIRQLEWQEGQVKVEQLLRGSPYPKTFLEVAVEIILKAWGLQVSSNILSKVIEFSYRDVELDYLKQISASHPDEGPKSGKFRCKELLLNYKDCLRMIRSLQVSD